MKTLIKKLIAYDKIYHHLKDSFLYHARKRLNGQIADTMYGHPSKDFFVIGVTGTNGKTTTVNLIHKILNDNVAKTMSVSTANIKIGDKELKNKKKMTSLDIYDLQSQLAIAKDSGCKIAVLEASSQGLDQYRFEGVRFDFAVLTNITRDHLDYHKTMEKYAKSKKMLFNYVLHNGKNKKYAVLNADDERGRKRFEEMPFDKKVSYGINFSAVLKAENIQESRTHTTFICNYLGKEYPITTSLPGQFNVSNILAAIGVATEIGVPMDKIIASIQDFAEVEGRMQKIEHKGITAYIDFAHTPDALEKTLEYLHRMKQQSRLIVTFGATGHKDKEKRPVMGEIVDKNADIMIITDDDPDTENRLTIIKQIKKNLPKRTLGKDLFIIPERTLAIAFATQIAQPGDLLIFAGKGHESIQYTNFERRPRSDFEEVKKNLEKRFS